MPYLNVPMTDEGAIVEVSIGINLLVQKQLESEGKPVPPPVRARLLVDTGANGTSITKGLLDPLGLLPIGAVPVHTASGGSPQNWFQFPVALVFSNSIPIPWKFPILPITECPPISDQIQGLLGRDVLNSAVFTFNPIAKALTLSF